MMHRYPPSSMVSDHVRAGAGLLFTLGPIMALNLPPVSLGILVAMAALFAVFALQTLRRHGRWIEVTTEFIAVHPGGPRLTWGEVTGVSLAYFSTWRDGDKGWMELKLDAGRRTLRIDSRLTGFVEIARQAADAIDGKQLVIDPATARNMTVLGVAKLETT